MTIEILLFKNLNILPELFLGISLIYFVLYGTFLSMNKNFPLIINSCVFLGILILLMTSFLLINDNLDVLESTIMNNTINNDFLSLTSKLVIGISSSICLLMMYTHLNYQQINQFEYILLFLFSILGLFLLCSSNDLLTSYLAIELQSLSFYVLASFKKNSTFSVDAGIKYFILGAFASSLFLFGSSLIYGVTGTINFTDFKDLFFWVFPGSILKLSNLEQYYENQDQDILLFALLEKFQNSQDKLLSQYDGNVLSYEIANTVIYDFDNYKYNYEKLCIYPWIGVVFIDAVHDILAMSSDEDSLTLKELQHLDYWLHHTWVSDNMMLRQALNYFYMPLSPDDRFSHFMLAYIHNVFAEPLQLDLEMWFFGMFSIMIANCVKSNDFQELHLFESSLDTNLLQVGLTFILISLFFKLAIAPFHIWSPDVYEGSPTSSTFFFAVVPKLGLFVLLIRIFYSSFYGLIDNWRYIGVTVAIISILIGSFGGLEQRKLKTLLAYSSISHMGYSLIAFNSGTFEGVQMLLSYLIIYVFSGLCIWSIFIITRLKNNHSLKHNKDLTDIVLLNKTNKMLALFFTISLFSVAGFPPMIGFLVKVGIFLTAIESSMYFLALISILCSVISTFYYIRIIKIMYFEKVIVGKLYYPINSNKGTVISFLFIMLVFLFVNPTLIVLLTHKLSLLILN